MSLGVISWLWVMAAAVIPVMIHLWSRKSGKPKMLPTFRFLPEKSIARASRIELHEKTLLFLRIVLILLISLLLAGLFFDSDPPEFSSVKITESEAGMTQSNENENVLELQVPSERIDRLGWFHLVEQVAHDYNPDLILADGGLTADRFTGKLPELSADVEWVAADLPDTLKGGSWRGADNSLYSFIQTRTDSLIQSKIEPADEESVENEPDVLALTINSKLDSAQKTGFEQVAGLWRIEMTEADMSPGRIAEVQYGDRDINLTRGNFETLFQDYLIPGPHFGIQLPVSVRDSMYADRINMSLKDIGIYHLNDGQFQLTAVPDESYAEWFFAGVAHQLLKAAVEIDDEFHPELASDQRQPLVREQPLKAGMAEKETANPYLLVLILLIWAGERVLSNRRGM